MSEIETMTAVEKDPLVQELAESIQQGMSAWQRAGEIVVDLVRREGSMDRVLMLLRRQLPSINEPTIRALHRVGKKEIIPQI